MLKTYLCTAHPSLVLGDFAAFREGVFRTGNPTVQTRIESHPRFVRGNITLAEGEVARTGSIPHDLSTAVKPDPGVLNPSYPAHTPEPIPPIDPALLKKHGLPVPGATPAPVVSGVDLDTLSPDELAVLDQIEQGTIALPKLAQPSMMRRWALPRLVQLAKDRGCQVPKGATKDQVIALLYPDLYPPQEK